MIRQLSLPDSEQSEMFRIATFHILLKKCHILKINITIGNVKCPHQAAQGYLPPHRLQVSRSAPLLLQLVLAWNGLW